MARYRTLTRVSMLGLLILIVTIGLTAICVLTLVSTHANAALADRRAAIVSETYAEEMVGQTFLSSLDKQLIPSKKAGRVKNGFNSSLRPQ